MVCYIVQNFDLVLGHGLSDGGGGGGGGGGQSSARPKVKWEVKNEEENKRMMDDLLRDDVKVILLSVAFVIFYGQVHADWN